MSSKQERNELLKASFYPFVFVALMWLVKIVESLWGISFSHYGMYPLRVDGLLGIFTMPFLHSGWDHLMSNTAPFLFLASMLFYFYKKIAWKVFLWMWLLAGIWLWFGARGAYHIGASGLVYGLVSFLFFSGIFRRNRRLLILTLIVTFLYGGLIWGFFPEFFPQKNISWEGHLFGFISGLLMAVFYRKEGPQEEKYVWDDSDVPDDENAYWRSEITTDKSALSQNAKATRIHYHYKK
ncbi:MAG: rhomboid family intramembrane serine protease [Bacteroidetes bacterium 4572_77]|nr:MAG: rhomboid family intramembrane serine protease [Bacteroidetes bacterium 4572_77]